MKWQIKYLAKDCFKINTSEAHYNIKPEKSMDCQGGRGESLSLTNVVTFKVFGF
jgi:hypothetical protein